MHIPGEQRFIMEVRCRLGLCEFFEWTTVSPSDGENFGEVADSAANRSRSCATGFVIFHKSEIRRTIAVHPHFLKIIIRIHILRMFLIIP
jgi:hypothetical protein